MLLDLDARRYYRRNVQDNASGYIEEKSVNEGKHWKLTLKNRVRQELFRLNVSKSTVSDSYAPKSGF